MSVFSSPMHPSTPLALLYAFPVLQPSLSLHKAEAADEALTRKMLASLAYLKDCDKYASCHHYFNFQLLAVACPCPYTLNIPFNPLKSW